MTWQIALELDSNRQLSGGSTAELVGAIRRAADLLILTEFRHNEHIDVASTSDELVREVAEFGITYAVNGLWAAGIMSLRQPIELPTGFGPRPSMSFFLYNQDGTQAIARPFFDRLASADDQARSINVAPAGMQKYHVLDAWDGSTGAPSQNFVYEFDVYRFCVNDSWREVLHQSPNGETISGSLHDLTDAFAQGCAIKVGISQLCEDLAPDPIDRTAHEVFVQIGSAYFYTQRKLFVAGSHPVIRVQPAIPMRYRSQNWDFGWLFLSSDGRVVYRRCDPYSFQFRDVITARAIRWFVR